MLGSALSGQHMEESPKMWISGYMFFRCIFVHGGLAALSGFFGCFGWLACRRVHFCVVWCMCIR